jgi:hypothetical protein
MRRALIVALGLLISMSVAAQTCEEKEAQAVFSVLPSCGAGCASLSSICSASGVPEPDCSLCIAILVGDGRATPCGTDMYCWQEHQALHGTARMCPADPPAAKAAKPAKAPSN